MPLEIATYISDLNTANPVGSDPLSAADDHLRLIKTTIKNTFPNINSAMTLTDEQLNALPGRVAYLEENGGGGGGGTGSGSGILVVATLPAAGDYVGQMVFCEADGIIYTWTGTEWLAISTTVNTQDAPAAVGIVDSLPETADDGTVVFNRTDGKLYERVNGVWTEVVVTVSGAQEVADASITVAKFAQGIRPIEIVDTLPTSNNVEGRLVYLTSDDKIYRYTGASFVTGMPFGDLTGTIAADQIAANSIVAGKIQAGAISASEIAANAISAEKIVAGAVLAEKIAAGAITADKIATNAITTDKLAANSITAGKIQAAAIGTSQLAANAITSDKLATTTLITTAAQIGTGVMGTAAIANAAITSAKIGTAAVDTLKIGDNAVTVASSFSGSGDTSCSPGTATTVISGSVTTSGTQPVLVLFSGFLGGGLTASNLNTSDANVIATASIGSSTQQIVPGLTVKAANLTAATSAVLFTGIAAGTYTVSIKVTCDAASGVVGALARSPKLVVLETKR